MDGTLLNGRTIIRIAEKKGFNNKLLKIMRKDEIAYKKSVEIAKLLKCITEKEFLEIFREISIQKHAEYVVRKLKNKGIKTAIVTDSYDIAAYDLGKRLGIDYVFSNKLIKHNGHLTGEIMLANNNLTPRFEGCKIHSICKKDVLNYLCRKCNMRPNEVMAVGDGDIDICMLREAGMGIAFNAPEEVIKNADISITNLKDILNYI
ncbi:hypothetical protein B6U81_01505 [Thermoplasmatales archaeon ex4484_30]|nr:MAG: hypothetical protein B6U81_01505 [Thermoplasmatales archaeon ex4484_30]